ncbi:MAG TPA: ACP phosphodiesterase [Steroidobacteraceae bacterium]|nr:ACP phosphodiesterase [Steroidobacteraceae bacterium]
MNWLAHVFLSEPNTGFQLGNLLADVVRGPQREGMSAEFVRGAACHKAIDAFTDAHPVVKRSRARIGSEHRRFSGVLVDVFYDHYLARNWLRYSPIALDAYTARFYAGAKPHLGDLPPDARAMLDRIISRDLLGSYVRIDGVEHALRRISTYLNSRWKKQFALDRGVDDLLAHDDAFAADFTEFFPQLQAHVASLQL